MGRTGPPEDERCLGRHVKVGWSCTGPNPQRICLKFPKVPKLEVPQVLIARVGFLVLQTFRPRFPELVADFG